MPKPSKAGKSKKPKAARVVRSRAKASKPKADRTAALPLDPLLEAEDIQGNIAPGFNKDNQLLLFCRIVNVPMTKRWLARIPNEIATMREVLDFNRLFKKLADRRGGEPSGLSAAWSNIAFSYPGLAKLTPQASAFPQAAFRVGLPERAAFLGDTIDPDDWVVGAPNDIPDLLLIIAADRPESMEPAACRLLNIAALPKAPGALGQTGLELRYLERGAVLPDRGHEHFGFKDGISQPGIRGKVSSGSNDFLTPRFLDPSDPSAPIFGKPGQVLISPGEFIIGYNRQDPHDPLLALPALATTPTWGRNGSFIVFRRLRQNVAAFRQFLHQTAQAMGSKPGFAGLTEEALGSKLVGRWPSGAPLVRSPAADNPALGDDDTANNHFAFDSATAPVRLAGGSIVPGCPADTSGLFCPHAGHIRKVNPRDISTDSGFVLTRRILRRGIPYGPPLPEAKAGENLVDDGVDRGLLFIGYTSSIDNTFETLQRTWCNSDDQPDGGGHDPIIGQTATGVRTFDLSSVGGQTASIQLPQQWVTPTGGGYFFAPSISALSSVLAG
jgi:Dyp-type peroxidase family